MFPVIPAAAEPLVQALSVAFTEPTFRRFCVLMCGLIVTMGRRMVSHSLVAIEPLLGGHWSGYQVRFDRGLPGDHARDAEGEALPHSRLRAAAC